MGRQDYETETLIPANRCDFDVAHSLRGEGFDASEDGTGRGTPIVPVDQPFTLMERGRDGGSTLEWRQDGTANALLTPNGGRAGLGVGTIAFPAEMSGTQAATAENLCPALSVKHTTAVAFSAKDHGADAMEDCSPTLRAGGFTESHANGGVMPAVAYSIMPMNSGKDYKARQVDVAQPIMAGGPVGGNQGGDYIKQASAVRRLTPRECERLQGFPDDYTLVPHRGKPATDGPRYKALGNSMAVPVMRWIGERIQQVEALSRSKAA